MDPVTLGMAKAATKRALLAPRLKTEPGLRTFQMALTQRMDRKLTGCWIGSSSIEGSVASPLHLRMTNLLEKMLQSSYNPLGITGGYTVKGRDGLWTVTGSTSESDTDLGRKNRRLSAAATLTHTTVQPCTGVQIFFMEGPSEGAFKVEFAGGEFIITPRTTQPDNSATGVWESPAVARGTQTVKITAIGSCSIGNVVFRDGDQERGITMYNAGHAGGTVQTFLDAAADPMWARMAYINPDIVPVMIGINDAAASASVSTYISRITSLVAKINASAPSKTVWIPLIGQPTMQTFAVAPWSDYQAALKAFAATQPNCTYHPLHEFFPASQAADTEDLVWTDDIHPTTRGHAYEAQLMADMWALPSRRTYEVSPPAAVSLVYDWKTDPTLLFDYDMNALSESTGATVASVPSARGTITTPMTQATEGNKPTVVAGPNGRKAIATDDAAQQWIGASFTAQSVPATVISVFKRGTSSSTRAYGGMSTNYISASTTGSPLKFRLESGAAPSWDSDYTSDTNWHIVATVVNGANSKVFFDKKTPIVGATATGRTWDGISIGRNPGNTAWSDCTNTHLIGFSRALSDYEIGRIMSDLATETGLTVAN